MYIVLEYDFLIVINNHLVDVQQHLVVCIVRDSFASVVLTYGCAVCS